MKYSLNSVSMWWSRGEARWRTGPAAPVAHGVFRSRARREVHRSVSPPRSSNRACGFPAHGSRMGFTLRYAQKRTGCRIREKGRPAAQTHLEWETVGTQARPPCAGGGESNERCGTDEVPHHVALSPPNHRKSRRTIPAPCGSGLAPPPPTAPDCRAEAAVGCCP